MDTLSLDLFDSEAYMKINVDVARSTMDAYTHYTIHGVKEGRSGALDFTGLSLDQLKCFYYHAIPDDNIECEEKKNFWNVPFYLKSNFVAHLPLLEYYGSRCSKITEFGVGQGHSTLAFLFSGNAQLTSYDKEESKFVKWLKYKNLSNWTFHTKLNKLEETDLIFFGEYSQYETLKKVVAERAQKYLIFYNMSKTMEEPIFSNYKVVYRTATCHGLLVLEKFV